MIRLFFLSACVIFFGCNAAGPSEIGSESTSIIGGEPTPDHPAVVSLIALDPDTDELVASCTAAIIAPKVVLTAAHCVDPQYLGEGLKYAVFLGTDVTDLSDLNKAGPRIEVTHTYIHPLYKTGLVNVLLFGHDIGIALLAQEANVKPLEINRKPLTKDLIGEDALLVGYGMTDGFQQTGFGIKRFAFVRFNWMDDDFISAGNFWGGPQCNGDSGGPVIMEIDGEQRIVGVNSSSGLFCVLFLKPRSSRVAVSRDFIDFYLE